MANTNNPFMTGMNPPASTPLPGTPGGNYASDSFEVDLSGVTGGFTIPDGNYRVKCTNVEQTISQSGNPMFVWDFEVSEGKYLGFQSKVFTAITPAAMWKVAETVIALGVGQTGAVVKFKRSDVIGKECGALIEQSDYKGNTRSQISRVMSLKELAESKA